MIRKWQSENTDPLLSLWLASTTEAHPFIDANYWKENEAMVREVYLPSAETWVWEQDGKPLGYAYAHKFAERVSYRPSSELSVYLDKSARGRHLGPKLYAALIAILQLQNVKTVYGIVTSPNERSEALHLAMGFTRVSTLKNVGYKQGWRDVSWYAKQIGDYSEPLAPFRPVGALPQAQLEAALRENA